MRIHIMDLVPGDQLEDDTFNQAGVLVLQKNAMLSNEAITRLLQHNVDYVDIKEREMNLGRHTDVVPHHNAKQKIKKKFEQVIYEFEDIFLSASTNGSFDEIKVEQLLQPVVTELAEQKDVVSLLLLLHHGSPDDYTYTHCLQVGLLSYYIAKWLNYSDEEAYQISRAGYLSDIGKCKLPIHIINKPGKLTPEEFEEIKLHPSYSYEMIMNSTQDEVTARIALEHHERNDGSGYPNGLLSDDIHPYSKIVAVADVYTAMISNRVYQSKQPLLTVLKELNALSFGKLSPEPTQALIRHILPNFIGKKVLLSTGKDGVIVMNNQTDFFRPLIQMESGFVDLARNPDIFIEEVYL